MTYLLQQELKLNLMIFSCTTFSGSQESFLKHSDDPLKSAMHHFFARNKEENKHGRVLFCCRMVNSPAPFVLQQIVARNSLI